MAEKKSSSPRASSDDTPKVTTAAPVREADKTSYPVPNDAEVNDPPVRTGVPDVGISTTLGAGAGAHNPPDPDEFGPDGRPL